MKKTYMKPMMSVFAINTRCQLLAASYGVSNTEAQSDALSRSNNNGWDDED